MEVKMSKREAYSWLKQPGIEVAIYAHDPHTCAALKIAINDLGETIKTNKLGKE